MSSKLREALEEIWSSADYIYSYPKNIGGVQQCARDIMEMIAKIKSEPLRNCDIGTAKEQAKRFWAYCKQFLKSQGMCINCPLYKKSKDLEQCLCEWSQLPYESEVK